MEKSSTASLLKRTANRLRVAAISRGGFHAMIGLSVAFAVLLIACRLAGVNDELLALPILVSVPVLATIAGWLLHRRPTSLDAARSVDRIGGTKDLFLTVAMLDHSAGTFQPLVAETAEQNASAIKPADAVPFRWGKRLAVAAAVWMLLLSGVLFLPRWDLFGYAAASEEQQEQKRNLQANRKATAARIAAIERNRPDAENSKDVKKVLDKLKLSLKTMKPQAKKQNVKKLATNQKELGERYRKNVEKLKDVLGKKPAAQQFGLSQQNKEQLQKWNNELRKGSTESLRKEIDSIKDELKKLSKTADPVKKAAATQRLRKRLQDLADLSREHVGSKQLSAALKQAIDQLQQSGQQGMSTEALEALSESLDLTKLELEQLAQSMRDMKSLEQALKTLQMARRLNKSSNLDGEACKQCNSLGDYEKLYKEMLAKCEGGQGMGQGNSQANGAGKKQGGAFNGPGQGRGGKAPEDDSVKTAFKTERSRSAITAGKILLTLKTKGMGEPGEARKQYREAVRALKQGVSEAMRSEQIPPGYRKGIRSYFDDIRETPMETKGKQP